jgi:hypothetical protein
MEIKKIIHVAMGISLYRISKRRWIEHGRIKSNTWRWWSKLRDWIFGIMEAK